MNALTAWLRSVIAKPAERRRWPRHAFKSSREVRTPAGEIWKGIARDLSVLGMGAVVYADLKIGETLLVKYEHPDGSGSVKFVARQARVKSRHGWRYGLEFEHQLDVHNEELRPEARLQPDS